MSTEQRVQLVYEEELEYSDSEAPLIAPVAAPPPDYESSCEPITIPAPPYPGMDAELPDYCEVVTRVITRNESISDEHHDHSQPIREPRDVTTDNTKESVYFVVLIGCAIVAVVSFAPIGLVALFLSIVAARKWHFYKEQSVQRKTAIGCILLSLVVGIPMHVVMWRHFAQE